MSTMERGALAIETHELTKQFGDFTAVDHVNCEVQRGEIFGFLGSNGSGKSTTIKMLCGLLRPTSGTAKVAGFDIANETASVKRNIGYMSQKFSLYNDLTIGENIRFFGGIYGLTPGELAAREEWLYHAADLEGQRDTLTGELAPGWKQRLALGCAVLHKPSVVFLDEPTGGVDPIMRRKFWDLILDLAADGTAIFVTTHYLDEAEYCNRIMLIDAGKIIAGGTPSELKDTYMTHPVLEVELEDGLKALPSLEILESSKWAIETSLFGTLIHVSVEDESKGKEIISEVLKARDIAVKRVQRIVPSLEDVFIHLIDTQAK